MKRPVCLRSFPLVLLLQLLVFFAIAGRGPAMAAAAAGSSDVHPVSRLSPVTRDLPGDPGREQALRERQVEFQRRWDQVHRLLGERSVSRRSHALLRQRGLGPALVADPGAASLRVTNDVHDVLRVLLVRISFASDRSGDLTSVTTDGDFTLRPPLPDEHIDHPPRNATFFRAHLEGLAEYYRLQSGGRLEIDYQVLPPGEEDSYQLSDIADYGPGEGNFWELLSLERLVLDMIAVTDSTLAADGPVRLDDYDDDDPFTYVIFVHSGSDWQSDVNNDSPNDIPTFFVSFGIPAKLPWTGGQLSECSVIPETTNQDGWAGSIAAGLYHEFGHALGLVDLYSTQSGYPQVGVWSLMDSGTNLAGAVVIDTSDPPDGVGDVVLDVMGVLPPSLCAWDKWFLGWLETTPVFAGGEAWRLPAVQVPRTVPEYARYQAHGFDLAQPQALSGGISPREFFLIENRWVPYSAADVPDTGLYFISDHETDVILYLGGDQDPGEPRPRNTGLYDFFLPTIDPVTLNDHSGLLVWHVNMDRIEAGLATNEINIHGDGLRLVEADGIQDIGVADAYVLGFFGSHRDPFNELGGDALYQEGAPSSRCFDYSWTGLELQGICGSEVGLRSLMRFTATIASLGEGALLNLAPLDSAEAVALGDTVPGPRALDPQSVTPLLMPGATGPFDAVVFTDAPAATFGGEAYAPKLFAFGADGDPLLTEPPDPTWPAGAALQLTAPLAGPPVVASLELFPMPPLPPPPFLVGTTDGVVRALEFEAATGQLQDLWGGIAVGTSLSCGPVPAPTLFPRFLCCVGSDSLVILIASGARFGAPLVLTGPGGEPLGGFVARPVGVRFADETVSVPGGWAVFSTAGWHLVKLGEDGLAPDPDFLPYFAAPLTATLHRAAIPSPEGTTLLVFADQGCIGSWHIDGTGTAAAIAWPGPVRSGPLSEPAVADLDADGRNDLVLLTATHVHAFREDGLPVAGFPVRLLELFPLSDSTLVAGSAVICDATGDGVNEIFFSTDQGQLMGLDARGRRLHRTPFFWAASGDVSLTVATSVAGERLLWLAEAGGRKAPPWGRRWLNGHLAGYRLGSGGAVAGTSEWLGPAGGGERLGPVGEPARLAGATPWAAEVDRVVFYPNPLDIPELTVRFYSHTNREARLVLFNLEGEIVTRVGIPVQNPGGVNEYELALPDLASGLYVCQLERDTTAGVQKSLTTLAVER